MIRIALFGQFRMGCVDGPSDHCHSAKVRELFCYLLLHRDRPHSREMLASLLWGNHCTTAQSKKYLRKTLWQLQAALNGYDELPHSDFLHAEPTWIELHSVAELWLDVAVFEAAYAAVKGIPGWNLKHDDSQVLEKAVQLYTGYLLENWYQDWCLCDRERLHHLYLVMLDKLTSFYQAHKQFEDALLCGEQILQYDRARERTHQQLMRLYYQAGDRTGALRQHESCVAALKEELDIGPSRSTVALYEQIRTDRPGPMMVEPAAQNTLEVGDVRTDIMHIHEQLAALRQQLQRIENTTEGIFGLLYTPPHTEKKRPDRRAKR